jgi:hypothetical protein
VENRDQAGRRADLSAPATQQHTQDTGAMAIMIATTITHAPNIDTIVL